MVRSNLQGRQTLRNGSVPETGMELSRSFVDCISESADIPYDELLTDTVYADTIKEATMELGKATSFFNALSNFSLEAVKNTMSKVLMNREV